MCNDEIHHQKAPIKTTSKHILSSWQYPWNRGGFSCWTCGGFPRGNRGLGEDGDSKGSNITEIAGGLPPKII